MRRVYMKERKKRGCLECTDGYMTKSGIRCPYESCPYKELDRFSNYNDFVGKTDGIVGLILKAKG